MEKDKKYFIDLISKHCCGTYNQDLLISTHQLESLAEKLASQLEPLVSEKFAGMVDNDTFKEVAEFVELEINEKHSNYWSNIAMGNASARFWHAYKKYASKFSR